MGCDEPEKEKIQGEMLANPDVQLVRSYEFRPDEMYYTLFEPSCAHLKSGFVLVSKSAFGSRRSWERGWRR